MEGWQGVLFEEVAADSGVLLVGVYPSNNGVLVYARMGAFVEAIGIVLALGPISLCVSESVAKGLHVGRFRARVGDEGQGAEHSGVLCLLWGAVVVG